VQACSDSLSHTLRAPGFLQPLLIPSVRASNVFEHQGSRGRGSTSTSAPRHKHIFAHAPERQRQSATHTAHACRRTSGTRAHLLCEVAHFECAPNSICKGRLRLRSACHCKGPRVLQMVTARGHTARPFLTSSQYAFLCAPCARMKGA